MKLVRQGRFDRRYEINLDAGQGFPVPSQNGVLLRGLDRTGYFETL